MKIMKILLTITTILFAGFGLFKVLSFDIANPIMLVSLATLLLLRGIEYKNNIKKDYRFYITFIYGLIAYFLAAYILFVTYG